MRGFWSGASKKQNWCRWCGAVYKGKSVQERDGFCGPKCKQAHHRAYHAYVTNAGKSCKPTPKPSNAKNTGKGKRAKLPRKK